MDLASHNLQWLMCHKTTANQTNMPGRQSPLYCSSPFFLSVGYHLGWPSDRD